jgi:SAM-dependent methyltransferase
MTRLLEASPRRGNGPRYSGPVNEASGAARKFDDYAEEYGRLLADSIQASGESHTYFHKYKVDCIRRLGLDPALPMLDYGCGIGSLTGHLAGAFGRVEGYDPSPKSLELARQRLPEISFHDDAKKLPDGRFGAAVLSGVLHHVAKGARRELLASVREKLAPGGKLIIFEHNPWNPLTRRAVHACAFDDDAILLWPWELKSLARAAGYSNVQLDYIVFFPRTLARLRSLEPKLRRLFLGAQTMTVATRAPRVAD